MPEDFLKEIKPHHRELIDKVNRILDEDPNKTIVAACKEVGTNNSTYSYIRRSMAHLNGKKMTKRKYKKRASVVIDRSPEVIELSASAPHEERPMIMIIGKPADCMRALSEVFK